MINPNIKDIIDIVESRLNFTPNNITLSVKMGKGIVKIFKSHIVEALSGNDLYTIVPIESTKIETGIWDHNMSEFKIYKITKEWLESKDISMSEISALDNKERVTLDLDPKTIVYDSNSGLIEPTITTLTEFSLREKACLYLKVPDSGTSWLDKLIIKSLNMKEKYE